LEREFHYALLKVMGQHKAKEKKYYSNSIAYSTENSIQPTISNCEAYFLLPQYSNYSKSTSK
jgi:hypothetical protein